MTIVRWLLRLSALEWMALLGGLWLLWQRARHLPSQQPNAASGSTWLIDGCVVVTVVSIVGAVITDARWLGLLGFGAAVLGLALALQRSGRAFKQRLRRFWRSE